jgi:hypothetical protein
VVTVGVQLRGRAALRVTWILTPRRGTTEVDLAAQLQSGFVLARLVLLFGGRRWLRRQLQRTLGALAALAHDAAEDIHDLERDAAIASGRGSVRCTQEPSRRRRSPGHGHHELRDRTRQGAARRRRAATR